MAFFQTSVINKYLKTLDKATISAAYARFKTHFHNPEIQENIRSSKEEQYQGEFLIDLFVNVLGYTKNPTPNYNLTTEHKNVKDSKKADGAILINDAVKAVIELKGTNTTDLGKIEEQAFGYKNNQPGCVYVVTSNFEKLRFYIDNAVDHLEFNLFSLSEKDFALLYLCLAYESITSGTPKKIKDESVSQEDVITKQLYKDYSLFKRELYQSLVLLNPQFEPLDLFRKSQKLLDRFLFLFFAEDRQLLPPNSVRLILTDWRDLQERDVEIPLYDRFKKYFGYLNTGFKGKRYDVFAYNGGLFKADEILDTIIVDDELLYKHALKLSEYDFASEVDVNILGHIFENSLNELDEIKAQLEGQTVDKATTKRKKDGVFYTPKYITKYIVENTIGKLCTEKKNALQIADEDYIAYKKRQKKTIKALDDKLKVYREWLLQLTICDPACGSGAFLNQALDFLIAEHRYIDELQTKLFGYTLVLSDVEKSILENNLFGVDLNEESVEIAKLSLWLRTAQPNRKLNDLNNNIKCGNSLIDDPIVAGDKAFNWQQAFPQVFANGGFDVVIGNPPYVNIYNMKSTDREYFNNSEKHSSTYLKYDLYVLFLEEGLRVLKQDGALSYIIPSVILSIPYGKLIREKIIKETTLEEIVDFTGFRVFSDAMVDTCILTIKKQKSDDNQVNVLKAKGVSFHLNKQNLEIAQSQFLHTDSYQFRTELNYNSIQLTNHIKSNSVPLESIYYISKGIVAFSKIDNRKKEDFLFDSQIDDKCKPYLEGRDVSRYNIDFSNKYLQYDEEIMSRPTFPELHTHDKILIRAIADGLNGTFDNNGYFVDQKLIVCSRRYVIEKYIKQSKRPKTKLLDTTGVVDDRAIIAILNSNLSKYYYKTMLKGGVSILPEDIRNYPIFLFKTTEAQQPFIEKADLMLSLNKELQSINQKFQRTISRKFGLTELPKKLQDWYQLSYGEFIKELAKKKVKLSLTEEAEWEDYFTQQAQKALSLKSSIQTTDTEIDQLVYALYNLTEEEIAIVEGREALVAEV